MRKFIKSLLVIGLFTFSPCQGSDLINENETSIKISYIPIKTHVAMEILSRAIQGKVDASPVKLSASVVYNYYFVSLKAYANLVMDSKKQKKGQSLENFFDIKSKNPDEVFICNSKELFQECLKGTFVFAVSSIQYNDLTSESPLLRFYQRFELIDSIYKQAVEGFGELPDLAVTISHVKKVQSILNAQWEAMNAYDLVHKNYNYRKDFLSPIEKRYYNTKNSEFKNAVQGTLIQIKKTYEDYQNSL